MSVDCQNHLDDARTLAGDLQAQLVATRALLQARKGAPVLELSSREAYGFGVVLGHFADQAARLETALDAVLAQMGSGRDRQEPFPSGEMTKTSVQRMIRDGSRSECQTY